MTPKSETTTAVQNGIKLFASLVGTLSVAIAVRFWLPRALGPVDFGRLHFAESIAILVIGLTTLGLGSYIGREVAKRPEHASDFLGGVLVVRVLMAVLLSLGLMGLLVQMGKGPLDRLLVALFCLWQLVFVTNQGFGALLNAKGEVSELAMVRVVSKIVWGGGIATVLFFDGSLFWIPLVFLTTELGKLVIILKAMRKHLSVRFQIQVGATVAVLTASIPFYINNIAHRIYNRVDVYMISHMFGDQEVGWYGAAANIGGILSVLIPVLTAVILPMSSRIAANVSESAMGEVMHSTIRMVLAFTVVIYIVLYLHAYDLVALVFGDAYEPTVRSLQILAATFPLTYFCVVRSMHMITLGKIRTVMWISVMGLVLNPSLNFFALPYGHALLGPGGAGVAAAGATVFTEIMVAAALLLSLGRDGNNRTLGILILKLAFLCALVVGLHQVEPWPGLWWAPVEALLYLAVGWLIGAVPVATLVSGLKNALAKRVASPPSGDAD